MKVICEMNATHYFYFVGGQEQEVSRKSDLENKDQTVHFVRPKREEELLKIGSTTKKISTILFGSLTSNVGRERYN